MKFIHPVGGSSGRGHLALARAVRRAFFASTRDQFPDDAPNGALGGQDALPPKALSSKAISAKAIPSKARLTEARPT